MREHERAFQSEELWPALSSRTPAHAAPAEIELRRPGLGYGLMSIPISWELLAITPQRPSSTQPSKFSSGLLGLQTNPNRVKNYPQFHLLATNCFGLVFARYKIAEKAEF